MKVRGERGRSALYIGCVYMPTDCTGTATRDDSYSLLKEDVLTFKQKGKVVLLGDFNRVRENVLAGNRQEKKLRVGTRNFSGLCS